MDINLWFARDIHTSEIIQVFDANNNNKYTCPICNSEVIPKALESKKVTPHFAHIDRSKCSNELMIHWWYKHKFIDKGDVFTIKTDKDIQFVCTDTDVEVEYELSSGKYKPDLVVRTECGNEIIFEMANTNKKKVEDYIDRWIELDKIIVEVDIKNLVNGNKEFNALYYKGKCFNFNKRDGGYYNTIGKLKERMVADGNYDIEKIKQLDWFWKEVAKYKISDDARELYLIMDCFDFKYLKEIDKILYRLKCKYIYYDYFSKRTFNIYRKLLDRLKVKYSNYVCDIVDFRVERIVDELDAYISVKNLKDGCTYLHSIVRETEEELYANIKGLLDGNKQYLLYKRKSKQIEDDFYSKITKFTPILDKYLKSISIKYGYSVKYSFYNKGINHRDLIAKEDFVLSLFLEYDERVVLRFECNFKELYKSLYNFKKSVIKYFDELIQFNAEEIVKLKDFELKLLNEFGKYKITLWSYYPAPDKYYIQLSMSNRYLCSFDIEVNDNLIDKMVYIKSQLIHEITEEWSNYCVECDEIISMTIKNIDFYISKGFNPPKRCKTCRNKSRK